MTGRFLWLPALSMYGLDIALTLAGQPAEYWAGNYARAVEANPLASLLLETSPALFLISAIGWAAAFLLILTIARDRVARPVAYLITAGHTLGAASWLIKLGWPGIVSAVLLAVAVERVLRHLTFTPKTISPGLTFAPVEERG